jgi:hypothetical protein
MFRVLSFVFGAKRLGCQIQETKLGAKRLKCQVQSLEGESWRAIALSQNLNKYVE